MDSELAKLLAELADTKELPNIKELLTKSLGVVTALIAEEKRKEQLQSLTAETKGSGGKGGAGGGKGGKDHGSVGTRP